MYPVFMYGSSITHYGERVKRQAGPARRVRREIRTLTVNERFRYFNAVNRMKTDTVCLFSVPFIVLMQIVAERLFPSDLPE